MTYESRAGLRFTIGVSQLIQTLLQVYRLTDSGVKQVEGCVGCCGLSDFVDRFVPRNTVRKYVRLWQESSLTMEQLLALPEHRLREMFIPKGVRHREPSPRLAEPEALLPEYVARLYIPCGRNG